MSNIEALYLVLLVVCLFLSAFFSGSETAFISTNSLRIEIWIRKKLRSAVKAQKYFQNPDIFLSTTLVGNNLANVLATTYATLFLITYWDETISWFVITLTILLFGEIIPKVFFRTHAHSLILKIVYIIRFFHFLLLSRKILPKKPSSSNHHNSLSTRTVLTRFVKAHKPFAIFGT